METPLNLQSNSKKNLLSTAIIILLVYAAYKIATGNFGPVPFQINVNDTDVEKIVVQLSVKGMQAPFKGGHATITRYTLYEDEMLANSNAIMEFPSAFMWMAMEPVEFSITIYHPSFNTLHKVIKVEDLGDDNNISIIELKAALISDLIDKAKQDYDNATEQMKTRIQSNAKDSYDKYHLIHIRDYYVPALKKASQSTEEIYQQVRQLLTNCEKLFKTFDYGEECSKDETFLRNAVGLT